MQLDAGVILSASVAQAVAALLMRALARGLGVRLERRLMVIALALPWLVLAPWFVGSRILVPCDILRALPGAPEVDDPDPHNLLNDAVYQMLPWELEVRRALADGRLPLWSDTIDGGSSPWSNPQAGVLAPIAMLARLAPIEHWLLVSLLLKITIACAGAWVLARTLGAARLPSELAAGCYALGGAIMPWALFPHSRAAAWLPWLIAGAIRTARRPARRRIVSTATITAFMVLAGHPEVAAAGGVLAVIVVLWMGRTGSRRVRGSQIRGGIARMTSAAVGPAAAAALGLALAGCQLVPFAGAIPRSDRSDEGRRRPVPHQQMLWSVPSTWFYGSGEQILLAPLSPNAFGRPYHEPYDGPANWAESGAGYGGLVVLAGVVCLIVGGTGWRRMVPFLVIGALYLVLAAWFMPVLVHLVWMPLFRVLAYRRLLIISTLCLGTAAAFGLGSLLEAGTRSRRAVLVIALALVATVSIAIAPGLRVVGVWMLILGAALLAPRWRRSAIVALVLAAGLDMVPWAWAMLPAGHRELLYPRLELIGDLELVAGSETTMRVAPAGSLLPASLLSAYRLADVRPHNPMAPAAQMRFLRSSVGLGSGYLPRIERPFHPALDFLNVGVVVASGRSRPPSRFTSLGGPAGLGGTNAVDGSRAGAPRLWQSSGTLQRWFLTDRLDMVGTGDLATWLEGMEDPARIAIDPSQGHLVQEVGMLGAPHPPGSTGPGTVRLIGSRPGRVQLEVAATAPAVLATSLPWPEGWHAISEGVRLPAVIVNHAFFGALVEPPAHWQGDTADSSVELCFSPPGLGAGMLLSAIGALVWLVLLAGPGMAASRAGRCRRPLIEPQAQP